MIFLKLHFSRVLSYATGTVHVYISHQKQSKTNIAFYAYLLYISSHTTVDYTLDTVIASAALYFIIHVKAMVRLIGFFPACLNLRNTDQVFLSHQQLKITFLLSACALLDLVITVESNSAGLFYWHNYNGRAPNIFG